MWQEIIVYIIGVAVLLWIVVHLRRAATRRRNPCFGCSGCELGSLVADGRRRRGSGRRYSARGAGRRHGRRTFDSVERGFKRAEYPDDCPNPRAKGSGSGCGC